jgi:sulfur carrier protein
MEVFAKLERDQIGLSDVFADPRRWPARLIFALGFDRSTDCPYLIGDNGFRETRGVSVTIDEKSKIIRLVVNGEARDIAARSLAGLLEELGYGGQKVATARNGEFVSERTRPDVRLAAGDEIEIVAPRQGG